MAAPSPAAIPSATGNNPCFATTLDHLPRLGAQSDPNTHFTTALIDHVGQNSVEAGCGEQQRGQPEKYHQLHGQPPSRQRVGQALLHRDRAC